MTSFPNPFLSKGVLNNEKGFPSLKKFEKEGQGRFWIR